MAQLTAVDATPWRRCLDLPEQSCAVAPRRLKRQQGSRRDIGMDHHHVMMLMRRHTRHNHAHLRVSSASSKLSTTVSESCVQDSAPPAQVGPCGNAADRSQLRRSTRRRRPSMKAAAASTPAGVDGSGGNLPSKKRCAASQQPLHFCPGVQRRRLNTPPYHQQTPQGSASTHASSTSSPNAHSDDEASPQSSRQV